jgi:hypothetical protein
MVRFTRARPFRVVSAWVTTLARGEGAQAGGLGLLGGNTERHLLVVEGDDVDFERGSGDFLGLDQFHLTHAMGGVDDIVGHGELQSALSHGHGHGPLILASSTLRDA